MARKPVTDMSAWPSLTLEGNLIAPAMVASPRCRAAWPLATAMPATPPSRAAMRSSSTALVGLEMRE